MGTQTATPKEELLRVALEAAARSILREARVTNARYREDREMYVFDLENARGKVGVIEYSRQQVDDFLDQMINLLGG